MGRPAGRGGQCRCPSQLLQIQEARTQQKGTRRLLQQLARQAARSKDNRPSGPKCQPSQALEVEEHGVGDFDQVLNVFQVKYGLTFCARRFHAVICVL